MEPKELLIHHFKESIVLNKEDEALIANAVFCKELKKKEQLIFKGDLVNHMCFVVKGCLRSYYLTETGQEYIVQFAIANWWINDMYSYLTKTPAQMFVQSVKKSTVLLVHRDEMETLFIKVPQLERFFRKKIERAYVANQDRNLSVRSETAEQRYLSFIKRHREIEQEVPQYMVASFLGISPEHLSSLRKNLHTKSD